MSLARARVSLYACLLCGCLDAGSPDPVGYSPHVLPENAVIARVEDDMLLVGRIGSNDEVDEMVPLHTAYAAGRLVQYWDFGTASGNPEPAWQFRRRAADGSPEAFGHPDLVDTVPGDMGYSPIRAPFVVFVTSAYKGERITSVRALEDAIELGLVEEPMATGSAFNWPVVLAGTTLEEAPGDAPIELVPVYYRGRIASQVPLGGTAENVGAFPLERGSLATPNAYVLRRQNEVDALDEAVWELDFNEDGDMQDSNLVFSADVGQPGYTSLWQEVEVVVPADYPFGESQAEADLFANEPWGLAALDGAVVEFAPSDDLLNRPIRYVAP